MSTSSSSTFPVTHPPWDSSCMRFRQRRNVLLPHPDGPMMAETVCAGNKTDTSCTAAKRLNSAVSRTVSSRRRTLSGAAIPLSRDPTGDQGEDQHQPHQDQGGGPREAVPLVERSRRVHVN